MSSIPVTVVIPILNEAQNLPQYLSCLSRFSEIIVVDSGSTDNSIQIALEYNVKVVDFKWNGKFPKKRNWVLQNYKFNNDWVFFLDVDEYINDEFVDEINSKINKTSHSGFWLQFTNYFMGRKLRFGDSFTKLALF